MNDSPDKSTRPATPPRDRPETPAGEAGSGGTTRADATDQPVQVDLEEAKLSRGRKAREVAPPGLMGPDAGPSG